MSAPIDYSPAPDLAADTRRRRWRRARIGGMVVGVAALVAAFMLRFEVRSDLTWVDVFSGSHQRQTVWIFNVQRPVQTVTSPFEKRLRQLGIQWAPEWRTLDVANCNVFGQVQGHQTYVQPAAAWLGPENTLVNQMTDADIRRLATILAGDDPTLGDDDFRQRDEVIKILNAAGGQLPTR